MTPVPVIEALVPLRLVNPLNSRQHWRRVWKRGKTEKNLVLLVLSAHRRRIPPPPRIVTLTRIAPVDFDSDGHISSEKWVRDGVAAFLGVDDKDSPDLEWRYSQERGPRGEFAVRIRVEQRTTEA